MNRRDTLVALLALGAAPLAARAQPAQKVYRIGVLSQAVPLQQRMVVLSAALRELGYEAGRNIELISQFAEGNEDRLSGLAADLVAKKVDLIVAFLNPEILAAKRATSTIPIVMIYAMAPVETGLVPSLAHPGGNLTGTTLQGPETAGKILQVLRDAVPHMTRVTVLLEPDFQGLELYIRATQRAAEAMGIRLTLLPGRTLAELEAAFAVTARARPDALYVVPTGVIFAHRARVIEFAARLRLPAIYTAKLPVAEGGLMSYSQDQGAVARRAAAIIDRILKGAKPADIPVEQPTKFELAINLKTAKILGINIPQSILVQADEVIE